MKRCLMISMALSGLLMLSGCAAQTLDLEETQKIQLEEIGGSEIVITDAEDIQRIIENLRQLGLEKLEYSEPSVTAYRISCYDGEGEELETFRVPKGNHWLGFDGYDHAIVEGSLDTAFWEELLEQGNCEPAASTLVEYEYQHANMQLELPEGWAWSVTEYTPDCSGFGISFWPEDAATGQIDLFYYPGGFGVCGTGLAEEPITFESGLCASVGTYDNGTIWDFISFWDTAGAYAAWTNGVESWWSEYGEEAMVILSRAKLSQGNLREEEVLELARQVCNVEYTYEYVSFDFESGTWTVKFRGSDSQSIQEVYIDAQGNVLEQLCGLPKAPGEGAV